MSIYPLLLKNHSRQSLFRGIATFIAIVIASLILLITISLGQGWILRDQKAELANNLLSTATSNRVNNNENPVYLSVYESEFNSLPITEVGVHKTKETDKLPAGLSHAPKTNEIFVTPGLKDLMDKYPALAKRYSKFDIRVSFPPQLAPSTNTLMLMYRIPDDAVSNKNAQMQAYTAGELWNRYKRQNNQNNEQTELRTTLSIVGAVILIVPVLLLIGEISKIGLTQREKRYATLNLVGVTRLQLRILVALETLPVSILGAVVGIAIFYFAVLPLIAQTPIVGSILWLSDITPSPIILALVGILVVVCTAIANFLSVGSTKISPLTVARTRTDIKKPSVVSIIPLITGVAGLFVMSTYAQEWYADNTGLGANILAMLVLFVILGIFFAGPYLIRIMSSVLARIATGASTTIAAYRLRSTSRKVFHSISGVVLALFVGTLLMTTLATVQSITAKYQIPVDVNNVSHILQPPLHVSVFLPEGSRDEILENLQNDPRLHEEASKVYVQKWYKENADSSDEFAEPLEGSYYESCDLFEQRVNLPCDAKLTSGTPFVFSYRTESTPGSLSGKIIPEFTPVKPKGGTVYDNSYVLVSKDRSGLEHLVNRTYDILSGYNMASGISVTVDYDRSSNTDPVEMVKNLEGLVFILLTIAVTTGGLSIIVSIIGGVFERKITFIRLRVMGAGISTLVRALFIEILMPLLVLSLLVAGLGIYTCYCFFSTTGAINDELIEFSLPSPVLWAGIGFAVLISAIILLLIIPTLSRLISFDEMRSE